jgi:predicted TIM-barrel fold metal-dependent hydrolase
MATARVLSRYPRLRVILSHAGGTLPFLAYRIAGTVPLLESWDGSPEDVLTELRRFYFDTALSAGPTSLPSLQAFADPGHILYGSDGPFAPVPAVAEFDRNLDSYDWPGDELRAINRGNAESLFPRLAA